MPEDKGKADKTADAAGGTGWIKIVLIVGGALVLEAAILIGLFMIKGNSMQLGGGAGRHEDDIAIDADSFKDVQEKIGDIVDLGPIEKDIRLSDQGTETQFLEVHIKLHLKYIRDPKLRERAKAWVTFLKPWMRDKVIDYLSSKSYSELVGPSNERSLKRNLRNAFNSELATKGVPWPEVIESVYYDKYEFKL